MNWLTRVPTPLLAVLAVFMCIAPLASEPHLLEKSRMLVNGELVRLIDIFDLLLHLTPLVLLFIKVFWLKPTAAPDTHD